MTGHGAPEEIFDEVSILVVGKRRIGQTVDAQILEATGADMIDESEVLTTGDVNQAVTHRRTIKRSIRNLSGVKYEERDVRARNNQAPYELVYETVEMGRFPVVNFAAGGIATPGGAALIKQIGCDGIFGAEDPNSMGTTIIEAGNNYDDTERLREVAKGIGHGMGVRPMGR
jgi:pyridoxal 5'-phosphate synthase pdxS subunit